LLFDRLRDEAINAISVQGSCHAFMRLADNRDAAAA
jgi:hypothetical protein